MHVIAAKAAAFQEALSDDFKIYQKQVVSNAKALADALMAQGLNLVSNGTDNHLCSSILAQRFRGPSGKKWKKHGI